VVHVTTAATKTAKALTAGELKKLQERAARAAAAAAELEDTVFTAVQEQATAPAEVERLKASLSSAMEDASHLDTAELKHDFQESVKDLATAKQQESSAAALKNHALVVLSRRAFQASIHPAIVGAGKQNMSKAGEFLGMPYATIRPYVIAGGALFQHDRAFLLSEPDTEDARIVNESFDNGTRKQQIEKRAKANAKAEAMRLENERLKLALEQAQQEQAGNGEQEQEQAGAGDQQAPAGDQQEQAPAAAGDQQAPATAPAAPVAPVPASGPSEGPAQGGLSLSDDLLATARLLVKQIAALKANKTEWKTVHPKLLGILGQSFPALKA
jgi:hypothetical protein